MHREPEDIIHIPQPGNYNNYHEIDNIFLDDTVRLMNEMVKLYSEDIIITGITDFYDFYDFMKNLPYMDYGENEAVKRQCYTLIEGGDCDQKSICIASFLKLYAPHIPQYFKVIVPVDKDYYGHVFNVIELNGNLLPVDSTYDYCELFKEFDNRGSLLYPVE